MAPGIRLRMGFMHNDPQNGPELTRRGFLKSAALTGVTAVMPAEKASNAHSEKSSASAATFTAPKRQMGKTGLECSILGVGGYHIGTVGDQDEINNMIAKAIDHGINFFDNAWEYHKGLSEEKMGTALKGKRDQVVLMTKVCTHGRNKDVAMRMLEESLTRLQTDHLDFWQVHEVVYYTDPDLIYAPDGVLEALTKARQQGKVRFVGFTGHKHPDIHLKMLHNGYDFDSIQMPLNALDPNYRSFEKNVLPVANEKHMAVFGMKSMGGSGELVAKGAFTPQEALTYAMSLPVTTTISGMDSMLVLDQNLEILRNFKPLSAAEMQALRDQGKQFNDGRFELYKSSVKYDGDEGRAQHNFPKVEELPA
ncbi:aldo/keto reductase [Silvibacterium acidisoli]|uniref:aldo/keto reductase n=1 Tax=Acidobacteriaceae bacterium ZG23-2 TaxID=2883246 RepID=UPI00406CF759